MFQFTKEDRLELRKRAARQPEVVARLKENVREVMEHPVMVPKEGIANWTLYYYCPKCSVPLEFDRDRAHVHRCPACGTEYSGEPYDGAWWGRVNAQNYNAAYEMGLIYAATEDASYAAKCTEILLAYAKYYPNYQVHGDIPYNGPGRSGAQTLDEANFQRNLAMAYDLVRERMTQEEKAYVRDRMFLPGAEFLMEHRRDQLHNHEVIISSAIAVIGMLFEREDLIQFAIYEKYGLLYQLEHGMLPEHMWFEGSFGYHFYALQSFFAFEKFAIHTEHSHIHHPNYLAMMEILPDYLQPDGQMPMLNDTTYSHTETELYQYEFAYRHIKSDRLLWILNRLYEGKERSNPEAFFYGEETLPSVPDSRAVWQNSNYHTPVGTYGHTILRGSEGRYLLFKHDTYGGEHDHYDRLGISYMAFGKPVSVDLGTTGYGAVLHYDYYKNTGTHNTVVIGEENQSPAACRLLQYEEDEGTVYVTAECDWTAPYEMPDSFTIVQWKKENYKNVKMIRKIAWTDSYFAEAFYVTGADEALPVDWVMHLKGKVEEGRGAVCKDAFSDKKPFSLFHNAAHLEGKRIRTSLEGVTTDLYCAPSDGEIWLAEGSDNPSTGKLDQVIVRRRGREVCFLSVVESFREKPVIRQVEFKNENGWKICVTEQNDREQLFDMSI
ncbi:MAG TPA: heparinase II/III family protein [Candidatus Eisenbergiella merdipullorum]|uniref:Heparinase II/III family protein n=1 Tax=Candidatus Eisenbergiella merdipullorum TaxID=2838553 RepID=A0A9D2I8W4_9FIRM|nr:heparinase II/III family protein [Candidatus Eisenbergiella merdipullorum]